jgi:hypothetical protein
MFALSVHPGQAEKVFLTVVGIELVTFGLPANALPTA